MFLCLLPLFALLGSAIAAPDVGYWLAGPKGNFYLIGKGRESWINAREYCMHRNSDLVSVDDEGTMTWLLQHFMPSPHSPGVVQIGLYRSFFPEWTWLSGKQLVADTTKIKVNGMDQCATLSLKDATYVSVPCAQEPEEVTRFVCERSNKTHEKQQKTDNGVLSVLESLIKFLGFGEEEEVTTTAAPSSSSPLPANLEDPGPLAKDIEHAEKLLEMEASGLEPTPQADHLLPLPEKTVEGSGADVSKELTQEEGSGEGSGWTEEPKKTDEIENDFNVDESHVNVEEVPVPPSEKKELDCPPILPIEQSVEMLATLRKFLNRAGHADFQRVVDDNSHSLVDRLLRGISEANEREFGAVQPAEGITEAEREMLFDEMSKLLVPDERTRTEALKMKEEFV